MSWHCSRALEAAFLEARSLGGELSAQSRLTRTAEKSSCAVKTKATSRRFPYGTTSEPLTAESGAVLLTWYRRGFLASRSPRHREVERWLKIFGRISNGLSKKFSLRSSSSKTCWRAPIPWGHGGPRKSIAPPPWVPAIEDAGIGWLPTPTTRSNQHSPSMMKWPAYRRLAKLTGGEKAPVEFWEWMLGLPIGWTAFEPLETDRFRRWSEQHGGF